MTEYDFRSAPDRRGTDSVKWDVRDGELPMWIADMDFRTAPEIVDAMRRKVDFGIFGYEEPHDDYFVSVANWYEAVHHVHADTGWMVLCTGVVPAISSIVRRVSHVGDNVLVQQPVYNIFTNSIVNNGRHLVSSDLVYDDADMAYEVDWDDLGRKLADPLTTLMILCNPHNPTGRVWTRSELMRIATMCVENHVVLLSDEIHGDLVLDGPDYTPVFTLPQPLRDNSITLVSPSKTFNLAALHVATVIAPETNLRESVSRGLNSEELAEPNLLAIPGTIAAYTKGQAWLTGLKHQLRSNRSVVGDFLGSHPLGVRLVPGRATYLLWLDCSAITRDSTALAEDIRARTGLYLSSGAMYGGNGSLFLRMNIACPPSRIEDGLQRLAMAL
ncbi:MalY/PatB family protein [Bifidobacterium bombi]|uniref:cysteine-S-conjugate beta-lyase n=1 Tax=Bifidobacterium bombi DSM 19703 TaxID=1341695 RepID=A0A080N5R7_9BIFI|nr:MalY/PatB family protein [Bifidobacterium bombi]KFF30934.1 aminotransferase [Bifidobacterium bombi DSM 19703]